jgi:hypothetical protein
MVIEWREKEHEDIEHEVLDNPEELENLQQCGLRKYYECPNMRAQKRLLQLLISYWEMDVDAFMMDG